MHLIPYLSLLATTALSATTSYNAAFDDQLSLPLAGLTIGVYDQLYYQGFVVINEQNAGLEAHSAPNAITHDPVGGTVIGPAALLTNYTGSTVTSLDLQSFWFGCATASGNSVVLVAAETCDLTVQGLVGSTVKATQTFTFTANAQALQPLIQAQFNGYTGLTSVNLLPRNGTSSLLTLALDNVQYVVHSS